MSLTFDLAVPAGLTGDIRRQEHAYQLDYHPHNEDIEGEHGGRCYPSLRLGSASQLEGILGETGFGGGGVSAA